MLPCVGKARNIHQYLSDTDKSEHESWRKLFIWRTWELVHREVRSSDGLNGKMDPSHGREGDEGGAWRGLRGAGLPAWSRGSMRSAEGHDRSLNNDVLVC